MTIPACSYNSKSDFGEWECNHKIKISVGTGTDHVLLILGCYCSDDWTLDNYFNIVLSCLPTFSKPLSWYDGCSVVRLSSKHQADEVGSHDHSCFMWVSDVLTISLSGNTWPISVFFCLDGVKKVQFSCVDFAWLHWVWTPAWWQESIWSQMRLTTKSSHLYPTPVFAVFLMVNVFRAP